MEKADKDPKKAPGRSVLPKKQEAKTGLSTQKAEKKPNEEDTNQPKREEEQEQTKQTKDAAGITTPKTLPSEVKLVSTKRTIQALLGEKQSLEKECKIQQKEHEEKMKKMREKHERVLEDCEKVKKHMKHFAAVDARRFREVVQMAEEERKQQVEKILANDEKICKLLGIPWKRPDLPFMERSAPIPPQKQALKPDLPMETVKKVMEQLCDEVGFLMEGEFQQLLAPLDKEEQTIVKLTAIFQSFGIKDVPELADFLLKYKEEQEGQTEDVCPESSDGAKAAETSTSMNMSSKVIHSCSILPALNSFLDQRVDYSALLKEIHELRAQDERLQRRKTELQLLMQKKSNSRVSGTPEKWT